MHLYRFEIYDGSKMITEGRVEASCHWCVLDRSAGEIPETEMTDCTIEICLEGGEYDLICLDLNGEPTITVMTDENKTTSTCPFCGDKTPGFDEWRDGHRTRRSLM